MKCRAASLVLTMSGVSVISVAMATTWSPSNGASPPAPPNIGRVGSPLTDKANDGWRPNAVARCVLTARPGGIEC